MEFFQECYDYFNEATQAQVSASQTSEWLLDNFYVIGQAVRQIEEDLPADYYRRLPKTEEGWTRIYLLAAAAVHLQGEEARLDIEQVKHSLQLFQDTTPLNTGELWALPLMLRQAVLEALARGLSAVTGRTWDSASQPRVFEEIELAESALPPTNPDLVVANSIMNLRLLATQDWKDFFESASILEKILRDDPAGLYAQMDFETRNRYRSIVEELADGSPLDEASIARQVNQLAQSAGSAREKHVGYYLIAQGRERLEGLINFHPSFSGAVIRLIQNHATAFYLGSIAALTFLLSLAVVTYAAQVGSTTLQLIVAGLLTIIPASSVAIEIINDLAISLIPPRTLPKLNFQHSDADGAMG
jgi:cyclic beta-1,2-glucan synthetase